MQSANSRPEATPPDPRSGMDRRAADSPIADWEEEGGSPPDVISSTDSETPEVAPAIDTETDSSTAGRSADQR